MRLSGTLLMVVLAATARADDPAAAPADSIAAAKKDLAAIKSPLSQPDSAAALPSMDIKDLGPVPGSARPEATMLIDPEKDPSLDPAKRKTGTGNWLVDAMDKNTSTKASSSKEKDDILKGDPDLIRADEKGVRLEKDPLSLDDARDKEQPKEPVGAVYNPLDAFMSGWVSARDRDLLLTSSKADGLTGADLGKVHADALPGMDAGQPAAVDDMVVQQVDPSSFAEQKGANPYLGAVDLQLDSPLKAFVGPDVSGFAPAETQDVQRGMSSSGVEAGPADASRSFIPDFAQPDDDDKYFKQMKKF
jgi:hypothetical protein